MGVRKYKTLLVALAAVPDPRKRRGQPHGRAIGQWVQEHGDHLRERLGWTRMADALRHFAAHLDEALAFISATPWTRLHESQSRSWLQ